MVGIMLASSRMFAERRQRGNLGIKIPGDCPHLTRWLRKVYERPSIRDTHPENFVLVQELDR